MVWDLLDISEWMVWDFRRKSIWNRSGQGFTQNIDQGSVLVKRNAYGLSRPVKNGGSGLGVDEYNACDRCPACLEGKQHIFPFEIECGEK